MQAILQHTIHSPFFKIITPLLIVYVVHIIFRIRTTILQNFNYVIPYKNRALETIFIESETSKEINKITVRALEKKFNFKYIDWPSLPRSIFKLLKKEDYTSDALKTYLEQKKKYIFTLKYINQEAGYALFTNDFITQGNIVGIYSGKYLINDPGNENDFYTFRVHPFTEDTANKIQIPNNIELILCSAKFHGNYCRFIQDLPSKKLLEHQYWIDDSIKNKIATENLAPYLGLYKGIPVVILKSLKNIQPGEMLGYQYSEKDEYWLNTLNTGIRKADRLLFNKTNFTLIDNKLYHRKA